MKVKELYDIYKDYEIMLYGVPLKERFKTTPFTRLPKFKKLAECDVIELIVEEEEKVGHLFNFRTGKIKKEVSKGLVYAYIQ